jgi:thioredoxin reductase
VPTTNEEVLIIGGGPAGLAAAGCLQRRGIAARIIEQGPDVAYSWSRYYDRVRLHTGKHLSNLPNMPFGRDYPLYVGRDALMRYYRDYARRFDLAVSVNERVVAVERAPDDGWHVTTDRQIRHTPALVVASGSFDNPIRPALPGEESFGGPIRHAAEYRNPDSLPGERVLVVGAGNSGTEIAVELADAGRAVIIAIRSGINIVPREFLGILPIQYLGYIVRRLPRRLARRLAARTDAQGARRLARAGIPKAPYPTLSQVPVIGLDLLDRIRRGRITVRGGIARLAPGRVEFSDGAAVPCDAILLATGYAPAVGFLQPLADDPATLIPPKGVASPTAPGLYFVGAHRTTQGQIYLVSREEGPEVARLIAQQLHGAAHEGERRGA